MLGKLIPVQGGESIYLTRPQVLVGSDFDCDVVLSHHSVEPEHCRLEYRDGTWFVEDLGTRNGVSIDGDRFDSTYIPVYSVLGIGTVQFEVHYRAGAPVTVGAENEASNVWPSINSANSDQFSSGGSAEGKEDEVLLAPADDSAVSPSEDAAEQHESEGNGKPAFKRLGFLTPVGGDVPHRILKERLYLGRDSSCDIVVSGADVSPMHCVMELRNEYWHVRNLKSNGLAIDGKKITEGWLLPESVLSICGHDYSVDYEPEGAPPVGTGPDVETATAQEQAPDLAATAVADVPLDDMSGKAASGHKPTSSIEEDDTGHRPEETAQRTEGESDEEPHSPLGELAETADELFSDVEDTTEDVSVETTSLLDSFGEEPTELATSKTFLLFEDDDEGLAGDTTTMLTPDELDHPAITESPGTETGALEEADSDFELRSTSAEKPAMPGLFDDSNPQQETTGRQPEKAPPRTDQPREEVSAAPASEQRVSTAKPNRKPTTRPAQKQPAASDAGNREKSASRRAPSFHDSTAAATTVPAGAAPDLFGRAALVTQRHELLADFLDANSLDGILLTQPSNISWFTAGADSGLGQDKASAVLVTHDERSILCHDVDAGSLAESLTPEMQLSIKPCNWQRPLHAQFAVECDGKRFVADRAVESLTDASAQLAEMRLPMSRAERRELRRLGHQVSHAIEATLRNFHRGASESEIAGQVTHRLMRHGIVADQVRVYADDRRGSYRRLRIDRRPVEQGCTLSVIARRHGLHVGASRTMCFGQPDKQILEEHALSLVVQATALVFSKHQWPIADTWKRVHRIYEKFGRADDALCVEPGWVTGYERCEAVIRPDSRFQFKAGMPVIWQQGVGTALSVNTVLIADGGIDILTPAEFWPTRTVSVKRVELNCPDILIRNAH
ncbi:MAG: FHA domain-containing protein [Planctomycetota bacterium]|jgi:Xaa-Pro aminopeptidase/pSer/pThr/pTyr-binding forkhead associated (FHA) protein